MILWRHCFFQKPTKLLSGFLPYYIVGRNPNNNFIGSWEKQCLHKIISVFTDLYYLPMMFLFRHLFLKGCGLHKSQVWTRDWRDFGRIFHCFFVVFWHFFLYFCWWNWSCNIWLFLDYFRTTLFRSTVGVTLLLKNE